MAYDFQTGGANVAYKIYENRLNIVNFQTLRIAGGFEPLDSARVKRALAASLIRLTAEDGGETIGMLRVAGDGAFVFVIADLLVHPKRRGEGIGTALVSRALDLISMMVPQGSWGTVTLVAASGREEFYRNLGFHTIPYGEVGHGMQAYVRGHR